ncbi:MAG: hypothetical protein WCW03_00955 [Candidatus Paceibacterota bacterium]|jgi:hypothetical protein
MQPETNGVKTWQWVVTVIVIIALIIIGIFVFGGKKTEAPVTTETPNTEIPTQPVNRIIMSDQFPGDVVYISSVQAENPSWVVVQKDDAGKPGKVIGKTIFAVGINPGKVTLTEPTLDGATYYAVMYKDDGNGLFDITKDTTVKDKNGSVIMKIFRATTSADSEVKG